MDKLNSWIAEKNLGFQINTAQNMKFFIKDIFSKCDRIQTKLKKFT